MGDEGGGATPGGGIVGPAIKKSPKISIGAEKHGVRQEFGLKLAVSKVLEF
jgi:hypothetical protein